MDVLVKGRIMVPWTNILQQEVCGIVGSLRHHINYELVADNNIELMTLYAETNDKIKARKRKRYRQPYKDDTNEDDPSIKHI